MPGDIIAPIPASVREADLGTHRLAYADIGAGEPIVFMHGGLMDHQSWGNQLPLADHFRLILPDTRGHGRSGGADLSATYSVFAGDLIGLMDWLGLERANLVGFSDGGCSALHAAIDHPDRVANLVLIGTPYNMASYNEGVVEHFHAMRQEGFEASVRPLVQEVVGKMRAHMSAAEWDAYWRRIVKGLWVSEPDFALSDLAAIRAPTLILHGEHERSVSIRASRDMAATIPDCELVHVPGASHSAAQDEPAFVNDTILRFLQAGAA
jgi:pimeloyl-ACP methyl ester carboxylesterase